ncbi:MAG: hypothetical protein KGZ74_06035 [Chitinophagaceae bacterium]|jgi:hypothetical protein|nr:hypothetical protein [Chitinophagaceae bacterium]
MPLKIVNDINQIKTLVPGTAVPLSFIRDVVNENYDKTKKRRRNHTPGTPPDNMGPNDSRSCWFPYSELEDLFKDNGLTNGNKDQFGVRIYFGMHNDDHVFHRIPGGTPLPNAQYDGQHTTVLVVTRKNGNINEDQLTEGVHSLSYGGEGMDIGSLCPPACDGGQKL